VVEGQIGKSEIEKVIVLKTGMNGWTLLQHAEAEKVMIMT
jgi:hypothetical protein